MTKFKIEFFEGASTQFNEERGDWSGAESYINMDTSCIFEAIQLTEEAIAKAINDTLYWGVTVNDLFFGNGACGVVSTLEDSQGVIDSNGKFLCTYYFSISPVADAIDLESLFDQGEVQ